MGRQRGPLIQGNAERVAICLLSPDEVEVDHGHASETERPGSQVGHQSGDVQHELAAGPQFVSFHFVPIPRGHLALCRE